jgi:hypothetical protein
VSLELNGNFDRDRVNDPRGFNILGESSFGDQITVYQCFLSSSESPGSDPAAGRSSFVANKAFIGAHFERMQDAKFKAITYQPNYLDRWLNLSIMEYEHKEQGFSLTYTCPNLLSFQPTDQIQIRIGFENIGPDIGSTVTNISFTHGARFIIELPDEDHFNAFGEHLAHLNNLIALAVMTPVRPIDVDGFFTHLEVPEGTGVGRKVKILLPLYEAPQQEQIQIFDMLFTYSDIEDRLGTFLENWFRKREYLDPVFDLFFGVLYNRNPYPVTTFLNYTQAIETYHIRTMSNEVDPPEQHRRRIHAILEAVSEEYREWLGEKLGFSNKPTFAQRLNEVIDFYHYPVTSMAGSHDAFIRRVRDTRNYYTHYDPSLEGKAQKGGSLKGLSMTLGTLLEGLLLHEMGFKLDAIWDMQRHRRRLPASWF